MRLLHVYKAGDNVGDAEHGLCIPLELWYDAPKSRLVLNAAAKQKLSMQFTGKLSEIAAEILVDSGASDSFMREDCAKKAGISIDKAAGVQVTLPDGELSPRVGHVKCVSASRLINSRSPFSCYATG